MRNIKTVGSNGRGYLRAHVKIILRRMLNKYGLRIRAGLIWLGIGTCDGLL
jgi:hypothetical protein